MIAVGCEVNTMGVKGVQEHACFMKELRHARWIRHVNKKKKKVSKTFFMKRKS